MTQQTLSVSVIVPTHNRLTSLRRMLDQLSKQSFPAEEFEVIVVADGCTDNSVALVHAYQAPFSLRLLEQSGQGAAAARNAGAAIAYGSYLIFLDDDIEPSPGLVEAHWQANQNRPMIAVVGYLPPILSGQPGYFRQALQGWWEEMFARLSSPNHQFTYREFFSGNCSLPAVTFAQIGGFDPQFRSCYDDYEFGLRLLRFGASILYSADAWGYHHETRDLPGLMRRKFQEGIAEVLLGQRHPDVKSGLLAVRYAAYSPRLASIITHIAFRFPQIGDQVALGVPAFLRLLERMHLHAPWQWLMGLLSLYWYYRGLTTEIGSPSALATFVNTCSENSVHLDRR